MKEDEEESEADLCLSFPSNIEKWNTFDVGGDDPVRHRLTSRELLSRSRNFRPIVG